ncbi:MAG: sulfatase-like hydrolase/transferase [Planctomycetota bacterium]
MRCGLALALFQIGRVLPTHSRGVQDLPVLALLFLLPLAFYGLAGWLLGVAGWMAGVVHRSLRRTVPALGLLAIAGFEAPGFLPDLPLSWFLAFPLLGLGLYLAFGPPFSRRAGEKIVSRAAWLVVLCGAVFTGTWLLTERDPARRPEPPLPPGGPHANVVLVTWDTVRADVLPLYGGRGLETPVLDDFASHSAVFDSMTAVTPLTGPAHATLLTGLVPLSHGLRSNLASRLAPGAATLASVLRESGYDTAAFVAAKPLDSRYGFARGFRIYDDRMPQERVRKMLAVIPGGKNLIRLLLLRFQFLQETGLARVPGGVVLERARGFLGGAKDPFFLWVHFFDAHAPCRPASRFSARARELAGEASPPPADPACCGESMTAYRGAIMQLDDLLGGLLQSLERADPGLEHTAVFLTADHGETFGEMEGRGGHLASLLEVTQHVPAVLHLPGDAGPGRRVSAPVCQVDVLATLCEVAGIQPPSVQQGVSLAGAASGNSPLPARPFFQDGFLLEAFQRRLRIPGPEGVLQDERKIGLRTPEWKFWEWVRPREDHQQRLFELARGEKEDLSAEKPDQLERMKKLLERTLGSLPRAADTALPLSPADLRTLDQLGYAGGDRKGS